MDKMSMPECDIEEGYCFSDRDTDDGYCKVCHKQKPNPYLSRVDHVGKCKCGSDTHTTKQHDDYAEDVA